MAVAGAERDTACNLVTGTDGEPVAVAVRNARCARLRPHRGAVIGDAGAQCQRLRRTVFGAEGEEPTVAPALLGDGGRAAIVKAYDQFAEAGPVGPVRLPQQGPAIIQALG